MTLLLLYAILSTAFWYLGSRAQITRAIWSRYPRWLARWADCPACTGFWYGAAAAIAIGWRENLSFMGLASDAIETPVIAGLCMIVCVPLLGGLMQRALWEAGSAIDVDPEREQSSQTDGES